jgi:hypothetical protein
MDTTVSNTDGRWCDINQASGSICTGFASNIGTCGGCDFRYFCNNDGTTGKTESKYDPSSNLECNKPNPTSCDQNLGQYHPGQTTGRCYKTEAEAKSDPVCSGSTPTIPPTASPVPTTISITASCQNIKAYSSNWTLLTAQQLSQLGTGNSVNFCVAGVTTGGSFDKAKFTINNVVQVETTTVRPGSTDFCQSYTIPAGVTTYNITAQIHHVTLGWK